ncbi:MAG: hypothetical protein ABFQ65_00730 [Nanoarchaeota archaeon]
MTRDKFTLITTKTKEGDIKHSYAGYRNVNACESEPIMENFGNVYDGLARQYEHKHTELLSSYNEGKIITKFKGPKIGGNLLQRCFGAIVAEVQRIQDGV